MAVIGHKEYRVSRPTKKSARATLSLCYREFLLNYQVRETLFRNDQSNLLKAQYALVLQAQILTKSPFGDQIKLIIECSPKKEHRLCAILRER